LSNKVHEAKSLNNELKDLNRDLFIESNPIPVKWGLHWLKRCPNGIRLPLTVLDEKYHQKIINALIKAEAN